ncbi:MAG: DNA-binding response regulator [Ignavibacteriae bacterium]|nr:MAG: DNA-binding response regulator [Ignavibacteriota bacterium]
MKIRVLIIDDEASARKGIRARLQKFPAIEILGECASGNKAAAMIQQLNPDIIFLDIQMPEMNGFEVLQTLHLRPMPIVIFVTAYDQYAIKAFEVHAFDYLLKPFSDERFKDAVTTALRIIARRNNAQYTAQLKAIMDEYFALTLQESKHPPQEAAPDVNNSISRILIKKAESIVVVPIEEVFWIEAAGDLVYVHTMEKKHIYRNTLTSFEQQLDPHKFVRVHRSAIVQIDKIRYLHTASHGDFDIELLNGIKLRLSRTYKLHFQSMLSTM